MRYLLTALIYCVMVAHCVVHAGTTSSPSPEMQAPALTGAVFTGRFVENWGQTDPKVTFISQSALGSVRLMPAAIALDHGSGTRSQHRVILSFLGAHAASVRGDGNVAGRFNYFRSADPQQWVTDVPAYGQVTYEDLYPGIDLLTRQTACGLKLEFTVAPHADPSIIRMQYTGISSAFVDPRGILVLGTAAGDLMDAAPVAHQTIEGINRPVAIQYDLRSDGTVGFTVGPYDLDSAITIDPLLVWSSFLGGSLDDHGIDITSDANGYLYVSGHTRSSTDFPVTPGAYQTVYGGADRDVFVAKISADGDSLIWCTYLGAADTTNGESGTSVSVASDGTVWVSGYTMSANFPTTVGAFDRTYNGGFLSGDAYVACLSATGSALLYSTLIGGVADEWAWGVEARNGMAYLAGFTSSPNFPTTPGAYDNTYNGAGAQFVGDAFFAVINPAGGGAADLVYGTFIGGSSDEGARGIAVDASGVAHITGSTTSANLPVTAGAYQTSAGGSSDAFVVRITPSGGGAADLLYSTYLGGSANDGGLSVDLDTAGNVYLGGLTASDSDFPTTSGAYQPVYGGGMYDAFAAEITPSGGGANDLLYSTYFGGSGSETGEGEGALLIHSGTGIRVSENGCGVYLHTITQSADFPTTVGAWDPTFNGRDDAVVAKMTFAGQGGADLLYSTYLGGGGQEHWFGISVTSKDDVAIICGASTIDYPGSTTPSDYPTTAGSFQPSYAGGYEDVAITLCGFTDYGDAPDTYGTLQASSGPRHILGQLRLGSGWDAEPDGTPSGLADGDDLMADWPDDEDGVVLLGAGPSGGPYALPYQSGQNGAVQVTVTGVPSGQQAWLAGWFDWDGDGAFANPGERVLLQAVTSSMDTIDFAVPGGATIGTVFARFRLGWNQSDIETPTASVAVCDGEVEDYSVIIVPVELGSFGAAYDGEGILVTWVTHSECSNLGFYLYRARHEAGPYARITDLLPGAGTSAVPHVYTHRDDGVRPGLTYWYKLADVTAAGVETLHGPVCAGGRPSQGVVLLDVPAPHPVLDHAEVRFAVPAPCQVTLSLCDMAGREIRVLTQGAVDTGAHTTEIVRDTGGRLGAGSYLLRLHTPFGVRTTVVVLAE